MVLITSENIKLWKHYEKILTYNCMKENNDFESILRSGW